MPVTVDEVEYYRFSPALGVPYNLEAMDESWSAEQSSCNMRLRAPWSYRVGLIQELLGYSYFNGSTIIRIPPARHPLASWMFCHACDVEGQGKIVPGTTGLFMEIKYMGGAVITAHFKTPDAPQFEETEVQQYPDQESQEIELATEEQTFSSEFLELPKNAFVIKTSTLGDKPLVHPLGKLIGHREITYTRHFVPVLPENTIDDLLGKVNDAVFPGTFNSAGGLRNRAAETLLFVGASANRITTTQGVKAWRLSYKFLFRPSRVRTVGPNETVNDWAGWNRAFSFEDSDWRRVVSPGTTRGPYLKGNFKRLFSRTAN